MEKVMIQFDGYETIKKHYGKKVFAVISIEKGKDNYEYHSSEYGELLPVESRPKGKWKETEAFPHWLYCDQCFKRIVPNVNWISEYNIPTNYCPNCGADMRGEE